MTQHVRSFVLAPGQEGPRTDHRGHALQLNIKRPVWDATRYLLYHKVFEAVRGQGGLTGYAHVHPEVDAILHATRGLAIDMPFGLVDFIEIMMAQGTAGVSPPLAGTSTWFDFLNLGYKLSPAAGTDYFGAAATPGSVRNYVQVEGPFTSQAWFDALKHGRTFVTNGPMLEFSINGQGMGSELHMKSGDSLVIEAKASVNLDLGDLASLELIEQGKLVQAVSGESSTQNIVLRHSSPAQDGTWFVVRARGRNPDVIAISSPIYIFVNERNFWKRSEVPVIVARLKQAMREVLKPNGQPEEHTEGWETQASLEKYWPEQSTVLRTRIEQASPHCLTKNATGMYPLPHQKCYRKLASISEEVLQGAGRFPI